MLKAIHKSTGKIIPAFKLTSDASWIGKENEEWISPKYEIENWDFLKEKGVTEVKVSFIKDHQREINGNKFLVSEHFRIVSEYAHPCPENESEEHQLAKLGIYDDVVNNELKINGKGIRDLFELEDIDFEYKISKSKFSKIADVIVFFKNKDSQYGRGIVFEIQLSHQNIENTDDRTFDRVVEGFSVVWLWDGMFKENKLIDKNLQVVPFLKAVEEFKESKEKDFKENLNQYGISLDNKFEEISKQLKETEKRYASTLNSLKEEEQKAVGNITLSFSKIIEQQLKSFQDKASLLIKEDEQIKSLIKNSIDYNYIVDIIKSKEIDNIKQKIEAEISQGVLTEIRNSLSNINPEVLNRIVKTKAEEIASKFGEFNLKGEIYIECNKCQKNFPAIMYHVDNGKVLCPNCVNEKRITESKIKEAERWF